MANIKQSDATKPSALQLIFLFILSWTAIKLSLPALPVLIHQLSTSSTLIKLSVTSFFLSYGLSQLVWGSLSERYGRRPTLLIGLWLAAVGTTLIIFSTDISGYIIGRSLEGLGVGAVSPICRSMMSDCFETTEIARLWAVISITSGIMPALAPIAGGFILVALGWRWIFIAYLICIIIMWLWTQQCLTETQPNPSRNLTLRLAIKRYQQLLTDKFYIAHVMCYACFSGLMLGYYGAMPFWFVTQLKMSENHYAFLAIASVTTYILALLLTRYLTTKISLNKIILLALGCSAITCVVALLCALLKLHGIIALVIIMSCFTFAAGLANPSVNAKILGHFRQISGTASALTATLMFSSAGIFSYIESNLSVHSLWPITLLLCAISLWVIVIHLSLRDKNPPPTQMPPS